MPDPSWTEAQQTEANRLAMGAWPKSMAAVGQDVPARAAPEGVAGTVELQAAVVPVAVVGDVVGMMGTLTDLVANPANLVRDVGLLVSGGGGVAVELSLIPDSTAKAMAAAITALFVVSLGLFKAIRMHAHAHVQAAAVRAGVKV